jgi:cytochrome c oxidase subunit 3
MLLRGEKPSIFRSPEARFAAGRMGMWLFLVTLAIIFFATLLAYVFVRLTPGNAENWPPPDMPGLPRLLAVSTGVLLASSATMHIATVAARRGERAAGPWMLATLLLGVGFLVLQVLAWRGAAAAHLTFADHLYGWTFYVLTILHAVHVVGGLGPMVRTTVQAWRGRYGPGKVEGIVYCGMYWHFLDAVWLVLYGTLLWGSAR